MISAEKIFEAAKKVDSGLLEVIAGPLSATVSRVSDPHFAEKQTLCFVSDEKSLKMALEKGASVLICSDKLKEAAQKAVSNQTLFATRSIPTAMAAVLPLFEQKLASFYQGIHPSAVVDPTAKLGTNVSIGPKAVIEAGAQIGNNSKIGAGAVIESSAHVGSNCLIHSLAVVGTRCVIGSHCELHSHVTIGSDGFGFDPTKEKFLKKIPQLGIVVLEDHVELGAGCAIDRATLGETRIGEGTKMDNHCHIAHNCQIGKHNAFAAGLMIAGSAKVGSHCMTGGGVVIADHVSICDGVHLGGRATVTKDITIPGVYAGYPLEPLKDAMRTLTSMTHLTTLRKQMNQVRKQLGLSDDDQ
jgi:UDP-3-O-[3-hydroxymyristoyl] glucosamine N-acyltransferase